MKYEIVTRLIIARTNIASERYPRCRRQDTKNAIEVTKLNSKVRIGPTIMRNQTKPNWDGRIITYKVVIIARATTIEILSHLR